MDASTSHQVPYITLGLSSPFISPSEAEFSTSERLGHLNKGRKMFLSLLIMFINKIQMIWGKKIGRDMLFKNKKNSRDQPPSKLSIGLAAQLTLWPSPAAPLAPRAPTLSRRRRRQPPWTLQRCCHVVQPPPTPHCFVKRCLHRRRRRPTTPA